MQQQVVYVQASESDPNTSGIGELCRKMTEDGFALRHVAPSQTEGGATVGLWLFFTSLNEAKDATAGAYTAAQPGMPTLSAIRQPDMQGPPAQSLAYWWYEVREKKGLGLSLTVTGVASVIIGTIVHFALRQNVIDTTLHLGYFFGVVGIFLFLIGLLILF